MDVIDQLRPLTVERASEPSFFNMPKTTLDPRLFDGMEMRPEVRSELLGFVQDFFTSRYVGFERWATVWVAGSAASYQWRDADDLDLDVLIGINMSRFAQDNEAYRGTSDALVASDLNSDLRRLLAPHVTGWRGYEVTFYVNANGADIRNLKPYAAFDLTHDEWTVPPSTLRPDWNEKRAFPSSWTSAVTQDTRNANMIIERYNQALATLNKTTNPAQRINVHARLIEAARDGRDLFNTIHGDRGNAFTMNGTGYHGFENYRWQSAKRTGVVKGLKYLHNFMRAYVNQEAFPDEQGYDAESALALASLAHTAYHDPDRYKKDVLLE